MVIKNLENKIKLVLIICSLFLAGCIIICISSIWTARTMVSDAHKKVYVLDGNVPILVHRSTMDETLDVEAKSHIEMFHHLFFTNDLWLMDYATCRMIRICPLPLFNEIVVRFALMFLVPFALMLALAIWGRGRSRTK